MSVLKKLKGLISSSTPISGPVKPRGVNMARSGNINLDDPDDFREAAVTLEHYLVAEVVAIPPEFELTHHLQMREQMGIFEGSKITLKELKIISEGVKHSAFFMIMNNLNLSIQSCMYYLHIINELGLVVKGVHNPIRKTDTYRRFATEWDQNKWNIIRGQEVKSLHFIIINMVPMLQQSAVDEAITIVNDILSYQQEIEKELAK